MKRESFEMVRTEQKTLRTADKENKPAFWASVERFGIGEVFQIDVGPVVTTRSAKANGYYWGVVLELIAEHTGEKPDDIHDAMCAFHLPDERKRVEFFNRMTGEKLEIDLDARRSSKLNGMAFFDFVEDVRQWARDFLQVETPDPDPEYWRKRTPKEKPRDVMRREKVLA